MRDTINMIGFDAGKGRFWNHLQGCWGEPGRLILSRNGTDKGTLIFTKGGNYDGEIAIPEPHVGGIDGSEPYLAVPTYDPRKQGGVLRIYNHDRRELVSKHVLDHRAYAAGICFEKYGSRADGEPWDSNPEFLIAIVSRADGQAMTFYRWSPQHNALDKMNRRIFTGRTAARNNIVLEQWPHGFTLWAIRAHLGYGHITAYDLKIAPHARHVALVTPKYSASKRTLFCSSRFAATIYHNGNEYRLLRTARNIFFDRLVFRTDPLAPEEI